MGNYIGIDIAKRTFDICCLAEQKVQQFENNTKGIRQAVSMIARLKPKLVVMEATGGYENMLAAELHVAKLPVAVVNPCRIRNFARANGQLAKTDKLDATVIAEAPKIAPYSKSMTRNLGDALDIDSSQVSIKATTTEKLGFTGRGEGIAAFCSALVESV